MSTQKSNRLSGRVTDAQGRPLARLLIQAFDRDMRAEEHRWREVFVLQKTCVLVSVCDAKRTVCKALTCESKSKTQKMQKQPYFYNL